MTFNGGFAGPPFENGTLTVVPASVATVTLSPANPHRAGWLCFNDSTAILYLLLGPNASTSTYCPQIPAGGYYELPFLYQGIITGVWSAQNGNARIWEGA